VLLNVKSPLTTFVFYRKQIGHTNVRRY